VKNIAEHILPYSGLFYVCRVTQSLFIKENIYVAYETFTHFLFCAVIVEDYMDVN
jgi:hypothetical protein